jgi:isopentenyl-diphosphate delta-isomerase
MTASSTDDLILVDENDRPVGFAEKLAAHQDGGQLHRAFSVFIFDSAGRMLLQRRHPGKYHFGGLWTNACCSHPRRGEETEPAAHRRLREELGFDTPIRPLFTFVYRAHDAASGLTENEVDHVFVGRFNEDPKPNAEEVSECRWIEPTSLRADVAANPELYTPWFRKVFERVLDEGPDALK